MPCAELFQKTKKTNKMTLREIYCRNRFSSGSITLHLYVYVCARRWQRMKGLGRPPPAKPDKEVKVRMHCPLEQRQPLGGRRRTMQDKRRELFELLSLTGK